jgi:hypothetical protein
MSEIKVDTLTGKTTANDITVTVGASATMSLEQGLAKAWIFTTDKTSYVPTGSFNVSSMTDNGTGRPETNFTNSFNDTNIVAGFDAGYNRFAGNYTTDGGITTSTFAHSIFASSGSLNDIAASGVGFGASYLGDLA